MTDFFALLGEPRRPWLDPDALKASFLSRSAHVHPDRLSQAGEAEKAAVTRQYAELNAAYRCLRKSNDRLAHLLHLERGTRPAELQEMPEALAELFFLVAQLCRQADAYLAERARTGSPMLRVRLFERGHELAEQLADLQSTLAAESAKADDQLNALDARWDTTRSEPGLHQEALSGLEALYRRMSFLARWTSQLQERIARLAE